jgi:hypothetical protein
LIITNDGTTTTNEYKDVAIGSIGNKPIYQFEASNLKEEGTSLSD